jgi:TonB family protein
MTQSLRTAALAVVAATGLTGLAAAAYSQPSHAAQWDQLPTGESVSHAYPMRALRERVEGRGVVTCTVNARGAMENCAVSEDTPAGYGFGAAALSLTGSFRLHMQGGPISPGGQVRIPLGFRLPSGETPTPPAPEGTLPAPHWAAEPTRTQVTAAYPVGSTPQATRVHGWVVLDCTTDEHGVAAACAVTSEDPAGHGFGAAAMGLASGFRLAPQQDGGVSIAGAKVRLVIGW